MGFIFPEITDEQLITFLNETAVYFRKQPDGGEDSAFWANEANAERCETAAKRLKELNNENVVEVPETLQYKAGV